MGNNDEKEKLVKQLIDIYIKESADFKRNHGIEFEQIDKPTFHFLENVEGRIFLYIDSGCSATPSPSPTPSDSPDD